MWAVPIRVALLLLLLLLSLSFFVSSSCSSFDLFINPLELLLFDSGLLIINIEKKVPNLFLSPPQPEDVRQMLNPFPPLMDSSTSVLWNVFGVGIKILILSSKVDLVWKDPDFNPGSLDETVSKRGLHAQSSLRSHRLLLVRRSPLGEWTVPKTGERSVFVKSVRAAFWEDQLYLCRIEKFDFPKLCQDEGLD